MHPRPRAETTSPSLPRFRWSIEPPREINLLDRLSLHNRPGRVASLERRLLRFCGLCIILRGCGSAPAEAGEGPRNVLLRWPRRSPQEIQEEVCEWRVLSKVG